MRFFVAIFSVLIGLSPLTGQAAEKTFPQLFAEATGIAGRPVIQNGNSFAAGQTYAGPYGGSYTLDVGQWSGNSGTISASYNNFVIPVSSTMRLIYNGSWTYTGSVLANNMLEGNLTGQWTISGLGQGLDNFSWGMSVRFSAGMAYLSMTAPGLGAPITYQFSQADMLALLL